VLEFNFSTRLDTFSKKFQLDSNSSTQLDAISLDFRKSLNSVILHVVDEDLKIMLHDSIKFLNLIIDFKVIHC